MSFSAPKTTAQTPSPEASSEVSSEVSSSSFCQSCCQAPQSDPACQCRTQADSQELFRALQAVDTLVRADLSFALLRSPGSELRLVVQDNGGECLFEDLSAIRDEGFVLCPFAPGCGHPVALIRADHVSTGIADVEAGLQELLALLHKKVQAGALDMPGGPGATPFVPESDCPTERLKERLFAGKPDAGYAGALQVFLQELASGHFGKLVLSRAQNIPGAFSAAHIFARACQLYPRAFVSLAHGQGGTWIGASPEILLEGKSDSEGSRNFRTMALAGTHKAGSGLSWDEKNRHEQALVASYIRSVLEPLSAHIDEDGPRTVQAASVEHLRTDFVFAPKEGVSLASLATALHPTPAVCGLPKQAALQRILATETLDRRYYAGFLGWWSETAPELYVNLRCLKLLAGGVRLYAGGGILPESTLESEWLETCHKMCTMLALLGRQERA